MFSRLRSRLRSVIPRQGNFDRLPRSVGPPKRRLRLESLEDRRLLAITLYVDDDSTAAVPDGLAWATSYADLQSALDEATLRNADADPAVHVDRIHLAAGTYRPTAQSVPGTARTETFSLVDGVTLVGGHAGLAPNAGDAADTRDIAGYETILSGDLDGDDDVTDDTTLDDNAYTVVYCGEDVEATIDGVTITAGHAYGSYNSSHPEWQRGGGVCNHSGAFVVIDSTIEGNSAADDGGALYSEQGTVTVTDSIIKDNVAGDHGGGIFSHRDSLTITRTIVLDNSAGDDGGGVYLYAGATLDLSDSTIQGNIAADKGGGVCLLNSHVTMTGDVVRENLSASGGGAYVDGGSMTATNSRIMRNRVSDTGGGVATSKYGYLRIHCVTINGNHASSHGGAIHGPGTVTAVNSTISGNASGEYAGGIFSEGTLTLDNTIVALNNAPDQRDDIVGTFEGRQNVLGFDPGFIRAPSEGADAIWGTEDDDYGDLHLTVSSIAVDMGANDLAVDARRQPLLTDLDGNNRIFADGVVDIGAFEFQGAPADREIPSTVVTEVDDIVDWGDGRISIREAVFYASLDDPNPPVTFHANLAGATVTLGGRQLAIYQSTAIDAVSVGDVAIDAAGLSRVLYIAGANTEATLTNLAITGGNTSGSGGGVYVDGSEVAIINSTIRGNVVSTYGGGIFNDSASRLTITGCTISGNDAVRGGGIYNNWQGICDVRESRIEGNYGGYGGGICNSNGELFVGTSAISNNSAGKGGGIYTYNTIVVTACTITENVASFLGGGLYSRSGLIVIGSVVSGNVASDDGGGVYAGGTPAITNSTVSGNSAGGRGGGVYVSSSAALNNTILALNTASDSTNDLQGAFEGKHNVVGVDPGFARAPSAGTDGTWGTEDDDLGDLHLTAGSIAIDMGNNALAVDAQGNVLTTDIDGRDRFFAEGLVDIGAHEFQGTPLREAPSTVVTTLDDAYDATDNLISLREALLYATYGGLLGPVTFAPDLADGTITLGGARLWIDKSVEIDATAVGEITVDGGGLSGVFYIGDPSTAVSMAGLTITGGTTSGVYIYSGALVVNDCTITGNSAGIGGGIYNRNGTVTVADSMIHGNAASRGGGVYTCNVVTLIGSTVSSNSVGTAGGGVCNDGGTLTLRDSTVSSNSANGLRADGGGGIYSSGMLSVDNSSINDNSTSANGGGIFSSHALALSHSTVTGNAGGVDGGGVYSSGTAAIADSTINGNSTTKDRASGGGIRSSGTLALTNSTVSGNSAMGHFGLGGGVYSPGTLSVIGATITTNYAESQGGGVFKDKGVLTLKDSIMWGNECEWLANNIAGHLTTIAIESSSVGLPNGEHGISVSWTDEGNNLLAVDPLFVRGPFDGGDGWGDDPTTPDVDESANDDYGDLRLQPSSPAIDAGNNDWLDEAIAGVDYDGDGDTDDRITVDLAGNLRVRDGDADAVATVDMGAYEYQPSWSEAIDRHVFYNNSDFDGYDPAANARDDAAIAIDKVALLPGETATFANYTSYYRGINGVMVDLVEMPDPDSISADDFEFHVGNDNSPGGWTEVEAADVLVREGAGGYGTDRVTIVFDDHAVEKSWLQVTVLANERTGLLEPDVFYFGNAVGESGDSTEHAMVTSGDEIAARQHPQIFTLASVDNRWDFNRDGRVTAIDQIIARWGRSAFDSLLLITPTLDPTPAPAPIALDVALEDSTDADAALGKALWFLDVDDQHDTEDDASNDNELGDNVIMQAAIAGG